jgi:hypothetical protein
MARNRGLALLFWLAVSVSATGCVAVYSTRPVEITVLDPASKSPVANVPVSVKYHQMLVVNPPQPAKGTTDASGLVTLPVASFEGGLFGGVVEVDAGDTKLLLTRALLQNGGVFETGQLDWRSGDSAPFLIGLKPEK